MKVGDLVEVRLDKASATGSSQFRNYGLSCKGHVHRGIIKYVSSAEGCVIEFDHRIYDFTYQEEGRKFHNGYGKGKDYHCGYFYKDHVKFLGKPISTFEIPVIPTWDQIMKADFIAAEEKAIEKLKEEYPLQAQLYLDKLADEINAKVNAKKQAVDSLQKFLTSPISGRVIYNAPIQGTISDRVIAMGMAMMASNRPNDWTVTTKNPLEPIGTAEVLLCL